MKDVTFGQYYPAESVIHRLDARAKIIFSLLYMIGIFFVVSYTMYLAVFIFLVSVVALAKIPLKLLFKSVKAILFILFFTAIINVLFYKQGNVLVEWWKIRITDEGINFAIKMVLRLSLLVMGTSLLTFTTTPTALTDAIESLLKPLTYIKVPVHDLAIIMSIALRFIPGLIEETDKIMMAQKARGANLDTGNFVQKIKAMLPVLIPLFVSAFRRADELADALDSRCYNASPNRTKMKVLKYEWRDLVGLLIVVALFVAILLDKYLVGGEGIFVGIDRLIAQWIRGLVG
ncbi:MAG: energy-coupling factor transporter transmembrane component T [Clostridia bacterium]|nr:energy-coupling factor transporter transmembrane component T [Clostridia bacterium]MDY4083160.1 energy-coupling factor transporter transmembrane component T [Eubacteriales bacterium]